MESARSYVDRDILVPASATRLIGCCRNGQTVIRGAGRLIDLELGACPHPGAAARPKPDVAPQRSLRSRSILHTFLPPFHPPARMDAATPCRYGYGRGGTLRGVARRNETNAAKLLPVARQALLPCRLLPSRRRRYPVLSLADRFALRMALTAARRKTCLGNRRLLATEILSCKFVVRPQTKLRKHPRRTLLGRLHRTTRGAVPPICRREFPRCLGTLLAFQAVARDGSRNRIRIPRREHRHSGTSGDPRRGDHAPGRPCRQHPQQLGKPHPDLAAALFADQGPAHRHLARGDGAGDYHRLLRLQTGRIPRGGPLHAGAAEGREYRRL